MSLLKCILCWYLREYFNSNGENNRILLLSASAPHCHCSVQNNKYFCLFLYVVFTCARFKNVNVKYKVGIRLILK